MNTYILYQLIEKNIKISTELMEKMKESKFNRELQKKMDSRKYSSDFTNLQLSNNAYLKELEKLMDKN